MMQRLDRRWPVLRTLQVAVGEKPRTTALGQRMAYLARRLMWCSVAGLDGMEEQHDGRRD